MTPAKSELQDEHFSAHGSEAAKARPSNPFQPLVPLMKVRFIRRLHFQQYVVAILSAHGAQPARSAEDFT